MSKRKTLEPDGHRSRLGDDEDVEGHRMVPSGAMPDGLAKAKNDGGPDDFSKSRFSKSREDGGEDDVEGHVGRIQSPRSRGE
jgi:hypothetical protein